MKECAKCRETKDWDCFAKSANRKDGHNPYSKDCTKEWRTQNKDILSQKKREYGLANKELIAERSRLKYQKFKDKYRQSQVDYYQLPRNWTKRLLMKSIERAKRDGIEHTLTINDMPDAPSVCPYLGVELTFSLGAGQLPTNASLDRIDSSLGYVKGNVQIISRKANTMKSNATAQELQLFATNILRLSQSS